MFDLNMLSQSDSMWQRSLLYLCEQFQNSSQLMTYDRFLRHSADMLMSLLLKSQPDNYQELLLHAPVVKSPRHVKRAITYIDEHLHEPIILAKLSCVVGVTARTLQKAFLRYTDSTPTGYIRNQRMRLIHQSLSQSSSEQSVSQILLQNGVTSFGHFSGLYKRKYGCTPRETLKNYKNIVVYGIVIDAFRIEPVCLYNLNSPTIFLVAIIVILIDRVVRMALILFNPSSFPRAVVLLLIIFSTACIAAENNNAENLSREPLKNPVKHTRSSVKNGKFYFIQNCANCHDRDGKALSAAMANAADLTDPASWSYGTSDGEIFKTITDGAGRSMPPFKYTISSEKKRWDIVNFVHSLRPDARTLEE